MERLADIVLKWRGRQAIVHRNRPLSRADPLEAGECDKEARADARKIFLASRIFSLEKTRPQADVVGR